MIIKKLEIENKLTLTQFLTEVQNDFNPPLFQRITENSDVSTINDYCEKLFLKANVFSIYDNKKIVAVIAIYTNDNIDQKAYIPILSVKDKYKGIGLATRLLEKALQCAKEFNMKIINVKTWPENNAAIRLYDKFGFKIQQKDKFNIYLFYEL
ncbi:GNAT family N-acetyltransferase [Macellibacteroides fermentans]|uniref:GNAT family N-acetyltransferase n=1 Tax=Macellibacteroides fermentans TaxID=879969 RepID=UPI00406D048F